MVVFSFFDNYLGFCMLVDSMLQLGENDEVLKVLVRVKGEEGVDVVLFLKVSYQLLKDGNVVGVK